MATIDEELAALEQAELDDAAADAAARAEQEKVDRVAYLKLKREHGAHLVDVVPVEKFKPGFTTLLVVKAFDAAQHRRFEDLINAQNKEKRKQAVRFAVNDSLLYPAKAVFAEMAQTFHELPGTVAGAALHLSKGRATSEGKG